MTKDFRMSVSPGTTCVRHVCIYTPDPSELAEFYQEVLGLQTMGRGVINADGVRNTLLLSSRPVVEDYQLEISANPDNRHTAFEVASLADLRTFYKLVVERGLPIRWALNHGMMQGPY